MNFNAFHAERIMAIEEDIKRKLKTVIDPEIGYDVVSLGFIYSVKANKGTAIIEMSFTTPFCPYAPVLLEDVRKAVEELGIKAQIDIVFDPPWSPDRIDPSIRKKLNI